MRSLLAALATLTSGLLVQGVLTQDSRPARTQAEQQRPTFRAEVNLIEIDVVALDGANLPVRGLGRQEFQILEDGAPKDIVSFAQVDLPVGPVRTPAANDVATNLGAGRGRLIFLVLDDANSLKGRTEAIKQAAKRLVHRLSPDDQVGLLWVSLSRRGAREFTTNHAAILEAIDSFEAEQSLIERRAGPTSATELPRDPESGMSEDSAMLAGLNLKALFDANRPFTVVEDVSRHLTALDRRRKAIVYIGQGANLQRTQPGEPANDVSVLRAIAAAQDSNVTFYAIDPSDPLATGPRRIGTQAQAVPEFASVASATGGFATFRSDPLVAVDRVLDATNAYYLLGYSADPLTAARGLRRIEVRTTRPGVRILARNSYKPVATAASVDPREVASRAVREIVPQPDLPLKAFAAPFRGPGRNREAIVVAVEVQAPEFAETSGVGGLRDDVQLVVLAVEPGGRLRESHRVTGRVALTPERGGANPEGRYLLFTRLELPPGQYQLRIGVHSAIAARAGSVYHDLTVPAFHAQPLSLSGLVLGQDRSVAPTVPAGRAATIAALVPFVPLLTRDFTARDEPWVFARVYRSGETDDRSVLLTTTVTNVETGRVVWTTSEQRRADAFAPDGETQYRVPIPIGELPSGSYRFRVEAAAGGPPPAGREFDFRVHEESRKSGAPEGTSSPEVRPAPSPAVPRYANPELQTVIDRASRYATEYLTELSGVVAEETYEQSVVHSGWRLPVRRGRRLRSDFLLVRLPGDQGWTPFRDVFEVDGRPVRDRDDRLRKLFLEPREVSVPAAREILAEGARYNIGTVVRNINQPMLPLMYLLPENLSRFELSLGGEDSIEGMRVRRVDYRETRRPTFIQDGSAGNVPSAGTFWIDAMRGRVIRSVLKTSHGFFSMEIEVLYGPLDETDFWAPVQMRESYVSAAERIYGAATYTNVRRFKVDTAETYRVKPDLR